jgi:putative SOS response-associated peptidase YedK
MNLLLKQKNTPAVERGSIVTTIEADEARKPVPYERVWDLAPAFPFRKPDFNTALQRRRCVIPVEGFILSKPVGKTPFSFLYTPYTKNTMNLAAYEDGGMVWLFTVEANVLIHPISDLMPAILRKEDLAVWMDPLKSDLEMIESLVRAYPVDALTNIRLDD